MNSIRFAKTTGAHFGAALLATVAAACNDPTVINICNDRPECYDASNDAAVKRDTPVPPDTVLADSGPSRSLLCGMTGCFPDNPSSCGSVPLWPPTLHALAPAYDDASSNDAIDSATDAGTGADAQSDARGATDAAKDTCRGDAAHDGASSDVSEDTAEPDATEDAVTEPEFDTTSETAEPPPIQDASMVDSAGDRRDGPSDSGMSEEPKIVQGCYIKPATVGVVTECAPVGLGAEGSACNDSHECGAQLACVEVDKKAVCRRITCFLPPDCLKGTYYQEVPLRTNGTTRFDLNVPACLPTDNCTLLEPENHCPSGKVCAVVGSDGDTTCRAPGSAKVGEGCDETNACAEGLLCSKFSNQCVKICHVGVDSGDSECLTGSCQGGNRSLPEGFGICIGQTDGG